MNERRHMRPPRFRGRFKLIAPVTVMSLAVVFPLVIPGSLHDMVPQTGIRVQGAFHYVAPNSTFATIVQQFHLRPKAGSLMSATGAVLQRGAYPGAILLNGAREPGDPRLSPGDAIEVVDGRNRSEPLQREVIKISAGRPGNPQFNLGTTPGEQIIVKGKISGTILSSVFRPTGRASRPLSVALTFDDGPWPISTLQILSILKRFHVKATFFVVGYLAAAHPDLVHEELAAGMKVGNHTWDHPLSLASLSPGAIR